MVTRSKNPCVCGITTTTPGTFSIFRAISMVTFSVPASDVPSGISKLTESSLWSSCGIQSRPM